MRDGAAGALTMMSAGAPASRSDARWMRNTVSTPRMLTCAPSVSPANSVASTAMGASGTGRLAVHSPSSPTATCFTRSPRSVSMTVAPGSACPDRRSTAPVRSVVSVTLTMLTGRRLAATGAPVAPASSVVPPSRSASSRPPNKASESATPPVIMPAMRLFFTARSSCVLSSSPAQFAPLVSRGSLA